MIDKFNVEIKHSSKRKNPTIEIHAGGIVKVIVPSGYGKAEINTLLKKKASWIIEKQREFQDLPIPRRREYVTGEAFPMLGKQYRLKVEKGKIGPAKQEGDRLIVHTLNEDPKEIETNLVDLYKNVAKNKLIERTNFYAKKLCLEPKQIKITEFKSQWGSCTRDGIISYNWQIITAPISFIDYLVVHELCHLEHLNHSKEFWKLVASVLPNYKEIKKKLKVIYPLFKLD